MAESKISTMLQTAGSEILTDWIKEQTTPGIIRPNLISTEELRQQCTEFLRLLA